MKYIIFAKLNKNYFLFLSYFIIKIIDEIINKIVETDGDIVKTFHINYILSMSDFLSIIPLIIINVRSKSISKNKLMSENKLNKEEESKQKSNNDIEYIYLDNNIQNNKRRAKRILKLSIIISIFEFLARYMNIVFRLLFKNDYSLVSSVEQNSHILISIILKYVLSIIILHYPFYKHHYLSMGINIICLIAIVTLDILNMVDGKLKYPHVITKIVLVILYSFEDVIAKILLSIDSISAYIYLFYRGIMVNSLAVLFSIVFIFVKIPDENGNISCVFTRFWKIYDDKINILFYIIHFIVEYLINLNIFLIIDKFSPTHFAMASILSNFGSSIVD